MRKNFVERDRPRMTIWRTHIACCTPKATNTHSQYVTLIAFPLQQWLQERATMLHCLSQSLLQPHFLINTTHDLTMISDARNTPLRAWCCTVSSIIVPRSSVALSEMRTTSIFTTSCGFSPFVFIGIASPSWWTWHHFWRPTSQNSSEPKNNSNYPSTG